MTTGPSAGLYAVVSSAADSLRSMLLDLSRDLHAHPELSLQETRSSRLLAERLAAEGFEIEAGVAGLPTAFVARRRGAREGPRVAFLAEYDALPGIGHACGHNLIAAAGLGAGIALGRAVDGLAGEVVVVGTPAEETVGGKCIMVREGVFDGIDAALMIHPGAEWRVEADSLACVSLEVTFTGREAHAVAWPERGINALDALLQLFMAKDMMLRGRGRDVRIPGVIVEGGVRANIVPARAVGHFSLRAPDAPSRDRLRADFTRAVEGIAAGTGCGWAIRATDEPYDELVTNRTIAARFRRHLNDAGVQTVEGPRANKGSLDMGNVSRAVPSVHAFVAICDADVGSHSPAFAQATVSPRGEEALMISMKAMALTGLDLLTTPGLIEQAKEELARLAPRG